MEEWTWINQNQYQQRSSVTFLDNLLSRRPQSACSKINSITILKKCSIFYFIFFCRGRIRGRNISFVYNCRFRITICCQSNKTISKHLLKRKISLFFSCFLIGWLNFICLREFCVWVLFWFGWVLLVFVSWGEGLYCFVLFSSSLSVLYIFSHS